MRTLILLRRLRRGSRIAGNVSPILPILTFTGSTSLLRVGVVRWRHIQSTLRLLPGCLSSVILALSPQFIGKLVTEALAAVFDWWLAVPRDVSVVLAARSFSGISTNVLRFLHLEDIVPPSQSERSCDRYEGTRADEQQRCEPHLGFLANAL